VNACCEEKSIEKYVGKNKDVKITLPFCSIKCMLVEKRNFYGGISKKFPWEFYLKYNKTLTKSNILPNRKIRLISKPANPIDKKEVLKIIKKHPISYHLILKKEHPKLILKLGSPFPQKLYNWLHDINHNKCLVCNKNTKFINISKGYYSYCSYKCAGVSKLTKNRRMKTNLKKYKTTNVAKNPKIKKKISESLLRLPNKKDIIKKRKETCLKKYGVTHAMKNTDVKSLVKKTVLKKYGVENPSQNKKIKEKRAETIFKLYGVKNSFQSKKIIKKIKEIKKQKFIANLPNRVTTATPLFKEYTTATDKLLWKCNICQFSFKDDIDNGSQPKCPKCFPTHKKQENELGMFIESLGFRIIKNTRKEIKPLELDIYIPSEQIAIEYCGIYWHSERKILDKNYHRNKYNLCKNKNIKLITIFEDDWVLRNKYTKTKLKYILKKYDNNIKFHIKEVNNNEKNKLLYELGTPSNQKGSIVIGLFNKNNNELISFMSFKKLKNNSYELLTIIYKKNIINMFNDLFKYFITNYRPREIIYKSNLCWNDNNEYLEKYNFKKIKEIKIDYQYVVDKKRQSKYKFSKKRLVNLGYNKFKTSKDIMEGLDYYRIWDCGYKLYIKKF